MAQFEPPRFFAALLLLCLATQGAQILAQIPQPPTSIPYIPGAGVEATGTYGCYSVTWSYALKDRVSTAIARAYLMWAGAYADPLLFPGADPAVRETLNSSYALLYSAKAAYNNRNTYSKYLAPAPVYNVPGQYYCKEDVNSPVASQRVSYSTRQSVRIGPAAGGTLQVLTWLEQVQAYPTLIPSPNAFWNNPFQWKQVPDTIMRGTAGVYEAVLTGCYLDWDCKQIFGLDGAPKSAEERESIKDAMLKWIHYFGSYNFVNLWYPAGPGAIYRDSTVLPINVQYLAAAASCTAAQIASGVHYCKTAAQQGDMALAFHVHATTWYWHQLFFFYANATVPFMPPQPTARGVPPGLQSCAPLVTGKLNDLESKISWQVKNLNDLNTAQFAFDVAGAATLSSMLTVAGLASWIPGGAAGGIAAGLVQQAFMLSTDLTFRANINSGNQHLSRLCAQWLITKAAANACNDCNSDCCKMLFTKVDGTVALAALGQTAGQCTVGVMQAQCPGTTVCAA